MAKSSIMVLCVVTRCGFVGGYQRKNVLFPSSGLINTIVLETVINVGLHIDYCLFDDTNAFRTTY